MSDAKIRLYVEHPLGQGQSVPLSRDQAHYLFGVMRLGVGAAVLLFKGTDGEWPADGGGAGKRGGTLGCADPTRGGRMPPGLWPPFAPLKKARTRFIPGKAAEG
ncbi:MAG: RNA methyltransferase PUA domain-containing protein, partial [Tateyamaria sp.]